MYTLDIVARCIVVPVANFFVLKCSHIMKVRYQLKHFEIILSTLIYIHNTIKFTNRLFVLSNCPHILYVICNVCKLNVFRRSWHATIARVGEQKSLKR